MGSRTAFLRVATLLLQFQLFYHFWIASVSGQILPLSHVLDAKERGERSSDLAYVPNKFIVEVEVDKLARVAGHRRAFDSALNSLHSHLRSRDVDYEVDREYDYEGIFVGAALTVKTEEGVSALQTSPGVKAIHRVRLYPHPTPEKMAIVQGNVSDTYKSATWAPLVMTGVDKVHARGIFGQGIRIAILDTGVDYRHPSLGGGLGPGYKIAYGYDFAGDNFTGAADPVPDSDPMDCSGHGTHVAGILGANPGNPYGVTGIAYGAILTAYKVFGCNGPTNDIIIIDALTRSWKEGQDIITMSVGAASGFAATASGIVVERIAAAGTIVTLSAGNEGPSGAWYTSSPAGAKHAISVGSVNNQMIPLQNASLWGVQHNPVTYWSNFPLPVNGVWPIYATSKSTTVLNDACSPLPDSTPDLSGYVTLSRKGGCEPMVKLGNIFAKGGNVVLFYDDRTGFGPVYTNGKVASMIRAEDGEYIVKQLAAGVPVKISFPPIGAITAVEDAEVGGLISYFSSFGPTYEMYLKPALSGPGGGILSTYPIDKGTWGMLSGTSMATPVVAGASALILTVRGKSITTKQQVMSILQSTSKKVAVDRSGAAPYVSAAQQGAGLVNAFDAIFAKTAVSPSQLLLNDTAHFKGVQTIMVSNIDFFDPKPKIYTVSHTPAQTLLTVNKDTGYLVKSPIPTVKTAAAVTITPSTFTLPPGGVQVVTLRFTHPAGLDPATLPVYSGFIDIKTGIEPPLQATYLGVAGNLRDKTVLDQTAYFFGTKIPLLLDNLNHNFQTEPRNYSFVDTDYPTLLMRRPFGIPLITLDLVPANTTLTKREESNVQRRQPEAPSNSDPTLLSFPPESRAFGNVNIVGNIFSSTLVGRNNDDTSPSGNAFDALDFFWPTFSNETDIANGTYRLFLRALRVFGDPENEADYDTWLSPVVGVYVPPKDEEEDED